MLESGLSARFSGSRTMFFNTTLGDLGQNSDQSVGSNSLSSTKHQVILEIQGNIFAFNWALSS
jgi:hypothetical protein